MLGKPAFSNKIVAKNLGIDEAKVKKVTEFFYKELDAELKKCEEPFIYVKGLGTFVLNQKKIEKAIVQFRKTKYNSKQSLAGPAGQATIREGIFELFRIRRVIKNKLKENQQLKNDLKTLDDSTRKCLSPIGGKQETIS
jgi:nucleoid DNA-binding protein